MGFPRQEYWNGLTFSAPGDLPNPGIEPTSPALQVDSLVLRHPLLCLKVDVNVSSSVMFNSLRSHGQVDCSPPSSSVHGILQARILEWVTIPFSRGIFLTQGLNPGLLNCRQIHYHLSRKALMFLCLCMCVSCSVKSDSLRPYGL